MYLKYGFTKLMAEKYIINNLNRNIKFTIGRIFSYTIKNKFIFFYSLDKRKDRKVKKNFYIENLQKKRFYSH